MKPAKLSLFCLLTLASACAGGGGGSLPLPGADLDPTVPTPNSVAPEAASDLNCVDNGNESDVQLNWMDNSDNETFFVIQREARRNNEWTDSFQLTATANAQSLTDMPGLGTFRYRIAATGATGQSEWTSWVSVSVTDGWTRFTPSADSRIIYVSSSLGDDANTGLSESLPKRTLASGYALLRSGFPDWLLLRRGDVWTERFEMWTKSGRGAQEPMLVGAYGTSHIRPLLQTGNQPGIMTQYGPNENYSLHDLAFIGFELTPHTYDGTNAPGGIHFLMPMTNLLIEDMKIAGYGTNLILTGPGNSSGSGLHNLRLRRCVIVDAYCNSAHSQGMFASGLHNAIIEENLFDNNGWRDGVARPTIFNHDLYITNGTTGVVLRRNVISNASSHGIQLRSGGEIRENLLYKNALGLLFGGGDTVDPAGVSGMVVDNIILEGKNITDSLPRGFGIDLKNIASATVSGNIIAHKLTNTSAYAIGSYISGGPVGIGVNNTNITENFILNWGGPFQITSVSAPATYSGNSFSNNVVVDLRSAAALVSTPAISPSNFSFSSNHFWSAAASNVFNYGNVPHSFDMWRVRVNDTDSTFSPMQIDSGLNLGEYARRANLGATADEFIVACRSRSRFNWNPATSPRAVLDYFRQILER